MGYPEKRDKQINMRLREFVSSSNKRPSIIADRAGIRRDTFSNILGCRRPIYADEIVPICNAAGCSVEFLLGIGEGRKQITKAEIKETLEKQLQLLSERSKDVVDYRNLALISIAMADLAKTIDYIDPKFQVVDYGDSGMNISPRP